VSLAIWDYLPPDTSEVNKPRLNPSQCPVLELDLPTPEGWKAELTWVTGYILSWFTRRLWPTDGHPSAHPSSNPAVHGRKSDFRPDVILSRWQPRRHFTRKSAAIWWVRPAPAAAILFPVPKTQYIGTC